MSNKIKRIGFGLDPAIENLKPVLSEIEGSKIENRDGWSRREFLSTEVFAGKWSSWDCDPRQSLKVPQGRRRKNLRTTFI